MRTFIALEPRKEFLEHLLLLLTPLKEKYPHFRWVPKENLHITLAFLGELDKGFLPLVEEAAEESLLGRDSNAISVTSGKLFTLPPKSNANVLALSFEKGGEGIAALAACVRKNLEIRGIHLQGEMGSRFLPHRRFLPHLTVARKGKEPLFFYKEDEKLEVQGIFDNIVVYKSELLPQGACYTVLASYQLGFVH